MFLYSLVFVLVINLGVITHEAITEVRRNRKLKSNKEKFEKHLKKLEEAKEK